MPDLDAIAARASSAALDVSPRGVALRPDAELAALLARLGSDDVPALAGRLDAAPDPTAALVWGGALARIDTPEAAGALDAYAARLVAVDPWPGTFPGRAELLLALGRAK